MDWQFAAVDSQHPCKQRVPDDLSQETVSNSLPLAHEWAIKFFLTLSKIYWEWNMLNDVIITISNLYCV